MPYDRLLGRYEQAIDFHEQAFVQHEHMRDLKTLKHSNRMATDSINLGRSCLAQARDMRHRQAAITDTEHASPVVAQQLDLAHPLLGGISHHVAPDLLLRAKELFTTALSVSFEYGILNLRLSCMVSLALLAFEMGDEQDALSFLSQYLDTLVDLGRSRCVGCGQERHKGTPMLTCSGCGVAR